VEKSVKHPYPDSVSLLPVRCAFLPILMFLGLFVLDLWDNTSMRCITWPCDLGVWPWRLWR